MVGELIIGALIGVAADRGARLASRRVREHRRQRRLAIRAEVLQPPRLNRWLCEYYEMKAEVSALYRCKIGHFETPIAFLAHSDWEFVKSIDRSSDGLLSFAESQPAEFSIDYKALKSREAIGQRIFDEPALYLDYVAITDQRLPSFHVKTCRYHQIASNIINLEEEVINAMRRGTRSRLPLRESGLIGSVPPGLRPLPLGCSAVMALKSGSGYEFVLHRRDPSTITFGGFEAVAPTFGLAPVMSAGGPFNGSILFYNFLREYLEELFNYEDLVQMVATRRADPEWIFDLPEAKLLLNSPGFVLECLGVGVNALNGSTQFALLARIEDEKAVASIKSMLKSNWEVALDAYGSPTTRLVQSDSFELEQKLRDQRFNPASAFALARTLERLKALGC